MGSTITAQSVELTPVITKNGPLASSFPDPTTIPDEMLYEVVDGEIVEKTVGVYEVEIANILTQFLGNFARTHGLGRAVVEMIFIIDRDRNLQRRPDVAFVSVPLLAGPCNNGRPRLPFGTWSQTWPSKSSVRVTRPIKSRKRSTSTLRRESHEFGSSILANKKCTCTRRPPRYRCCNSAKSSTVATWSRVSGFLWRPCLRMTPR